MRKICSFRFIHSKVEFVIHFIGTGGFTITTTGAVISHGLEFLHLHGESFDYVCSIYPTAPLLQKEYLIKGYEELKNSDAHSTFSATSMPFAIQRTFKITKNGRCKMFMPEHFTSRSQDLEKAYQDAGQFYWTNLNNKSDDIIFGKDSIPIILPRDLVQDIDTLEDWQRAEKLYALIHKDIYDEWNTLKKESR
jgi:CMP-N-acetylneuraminic acid synthetase